MFIIVFYSVEDLWHFFNHIIYFIIIFILAHFGSFRSFTNSYFADWLPPYFHSDVLLPFTERSDFSSTYPNCHEMMIIGNIYTAVQSFSRTISIYSISFGIATLPI